MSMLMLLVAAVTVISGPVTEDIPDAPAAGLGLAPGETVRAPITLPDAAGGELVSARRSTHDPHGTGSESGSSPWIPAPVGIAAALLGAVTTRPRSERDRRPLYFVVHGNGGSASDFEPLLELMDVDPDRVVAFDYRTVAPGPSSTDVSRWVDTEEVARELDAQLRDLARDNGTIYSIHHSKGGSAAVVAIAAMDDGRRPPIDGYRGAALLDPPIAPFPLGPLQRVGQSFSWIPDNGGFRPIHCGTNGCRDIREHLGRRAGVEVIVIRNPDAEITSFTDEPEGLRVYDLEYDGKPSAWTRWWNPPAMLRRVFEAHRSVLGHRAVASCITAEVAAPGSCRWQGARRPRRAVRGAGGSRNLVR